MTFKVQEVKKMSIDLISNKIVFHMRRENKVPRKTNQRHFFANRPALQEILKEVLFSVESI